MHTASLDLSHGIGLVLAGGGAKGAYQVGVLKALAHIKLPVHAISGASIGSLNGAVLAAAPSIEEGARRLEHIWETLIHHHPLKLNMRNHTEFFRQARLHLPEWLCDLWELAPPDHERINDYGLFTNAELIHTIRDYCSPEALRDGLPLFASLCEHRWWDAPLPSVLRAEMGMRDSIAPDFFHVQSLGEDEQLRALLASAAIPLLYAPQMIGGKSYVDGGLASWKHREGNTPLAPLLEAGCTRAVVVHLDQQDPWQAPAEEPPYVVEIRPSMDISARKPFQGMLDFDLERTADRMRVGYDDAMAKIQDLLQLKYME